MIGGVLQKILGKGDLFKLSFGHRLGVGNVGENAVKTSTNMLGFRAFPGNEGRAVIRLGFPGKRNKLDLLDMGPRIK